MLHLDDTRGVYLELYVTRGPQNRRRALLAELARIYVEQGIYCISMVLAGRRVDSARWRGRPVAMNGCAGSQESH